MTKRKTKKRYEEYLNMMFHPEEVITKTEHCWAGWDKTNRRKRAAYKLAERGLYGTILRRYDPIAFETGYNDWER